MQSGFVKEQELKIKSKEKVNNILLQSIIKTKKELRRVQNNYEFAEGELIDYYLYQMKAIQSKLDYLIKKSKNNELELDIIGLIEIQSDEQFKIV